MTKQSDKYQKAWQEMNLVFDNQNCSHGYQTRTGQHVWIAIDKKEVKFWWPKCNLEPNDGFRTDIHDGGPPGLYSISLYVLDQTHHEMWSSWMQHNKFGGLHMPPTSRRLDTVRVLLKG